MCARWNSLSFASDTRRFNCPAINFFQKLSFQNVGKHVPELLKIKDLPGQHASGPPTHSVPLALGTWLQKTLDPLLQSVLLQQHIVTNDITSSLRRYCKK